MRLRLRAALALSAAACCAAAGSARAAAEDGTIRLQFREAPLAQVIREVSKHTGAQFLFDEELTRARVTITGYDLLTKDEALRVLEAALLVNQLAALPTPGGVTKILPLDLGLAEAPYAPAGPGTREVPVTTLMHLEHAPVADVFRNLQPWLAGRAVAIPWPPSNSLILAGSELRLRSAFAMVRALDERPDQELLVRRLRFRGAEEMSAALDAAFGADSKLRRPITVWSDARTGSVIALGGAREIEDVRDFLARVDRPADLLGRLAVVPIQFADPEQLAETLAQLSAGGREDDSGAAIGSNSLAGRSLAVTADPETSQLLLSGDPDTLRLARRLIDELDRAPPAITIDAVILELTLGENLALGVDFVARSVSGSDAQGFTEIRSLPSGSLLGAAGVGAGSAPNALARFQDNIVRVPITAPDGTTNVIEVAQTDVAVTADAGYSRSRVYLRPHLTALSGEEHTLFAGDNIPIPVSQPDAAAPAATADSDAAPAELSTAIRQQIERQDVGAMLRLKPVAGQAGGIRLELEIEITELAAPDPAVGAVEEVGPVIQKRSLETVLHLRDGEQSTIAGLRDPRVEVVESFVPFLGRIPILGLLFKRQSRTLRQSFLVIAVRAQIQRSPEELLADSIRRRLAFERASLRTQELGELADAPYAVLLTTRRLRADAESLAEDFGDPAHPGRVVSWRHSGDERHDVYLTGFASLDAASQAAFALRERGFEAEVIVNPAALTEIP